MYFFYIIDLFNNSQQDIQIEQFDDFKHLIFIIKDYLKELIYFNITKSSDFTKHNEKYFMLIIELNHFISVLNSDSENYFPESLIIKIEDLIIKYNNIFNEKKYENEINKCNNSDNVYDRIGDTFSKNENIMKSYKNLLSDFNTSILKKQYVEVYEEYIIKLFNVITCLDAFISDNFLPTFIETYNDKKKYYHPVYSTCLYAINYELAEKEFKYEKTNESVKIDDDYTEINKIYALDEYVNLKPNKNRQTPIVTAAYPRNGGKSRRRTHPKNKTHHLHRTNNGGKKKSKASTTKRQVLKKRKHTRKNK